MFFIYFVKLEDPWTLLPSGVWNDAFAVYKLKVSSYGGQFMKWLDAIR